MLRHLTREINPGVGLARHVAIFLLAVSAVAPALVIERAYPGTSKKLWLILTGLPWLGVAAGGWIRDDARTLKGFRLGTTVEIAGLTLHFAQAVLLFVALGDRDFGADRSFIRASLIGGAFLSAGWLGLALRWMQSGPPPTPVEAAARLSAATTGRWERAVAALRVVGSDTILVTAIGLSFVAASIWLIARSAGGDRGRPQWIFSLVFFGLAAATGVWVSVQRYRAFVPGAARGRGWSRRARATAALVLGALLATSAIFVGTFPALLRAMLGIGAGLALVAGLAQGLGLAPAQAKITLTEEGLEELHELARVVYPWTSIQGVAIGEWYHQLCLTLSVPDAETAIRAASAPGRWIDRRLAQLQSTRRWYGADLTIFAEQVEPGLADLAAAIGDHIAHRARP